jgi:predicted DNA-binding transcriptional regulator AlpA
MAHTELPEQGFELTRSKLKSTVHDRPVPGALQFIGRKTVCAKVDLSPATIHRLIKSKQFPAAYSLGGRRVAWAVHEIDAWLASRMGRTEVAA